MKRFNCWLCAALMLSFIAGVLIIPADVCAQGGSRRPTLSLKDAATVAKKCL